MDLRSGSKGEADGDAKGGSFLGKVKARGVGERMATVGVSGSSVVVITSSAEDVAGIAGQWPLAEARCGEALTS